ncbi:unnamed protein product, partial [Oncorhynchus mykiss]
MPLVQVPPMATLNGNLGVPPFSLLFPIQVQTLWIKENNLPILLCTSEAAFNCPFPQRTPEAARRNTKGEKKSPFEAQKEPGSSLAEAGKKDRSDALNTAIDRMTKKTRDLRRQRPPQTGWSNSPSLPFLPFILPSLVLVLSPSSQSFSRDLQRQVERWGGLDAIVFSCNDCCELTACQNTCFPPCGSGNLDAGFPPCGSGNLDAGFPTRGSGNLDAGFPPCGSGNLDACFPPCGSGNLDAGFPPRGSG